MVPVLKLLESEVREVNSAKRKQICCVEGGGFTSRVTAGVSCWRRLNLEGGWWRRLSLEC